MTANQKSSNGGNLVLLGAGILCLLWGFALISGSTIVASMFLGANLSAGIPVSDADRLKVLFVEGGGVLAAVQGLVLFIVGLFQLVRNGAPQGTAVNRSAAER